MLASFRQPPESPTTKARTVAEAGVDRPGMKELARLGQGFLVWERSADHQWQIWTMPLDGSAEERRLVPAEAGRDHFCPKISPDGRLLAYMSYATGESPSGQGTGALWMMHLETGERTLLAAQARSYGGDRAVLWMDDHRLCHMSGEGHTVEIHVRTLEKKVLTATARKKHGWLVNATRTHATSGDAEFSPYDAAGRQVKVMPRHTGCQPYFSADGVWGFWMGGSGGPLNRMHLPTRRVEAVLGANDPRLPAERNYLYFPMLSPCQRLLAFAASKDHHDHDEADYDIFVMRVNRSTLEPIGNAVRCTAFTGNDRYPDVFCAELPLGSHFVEGIAQVRLALPGGNNCVWKVDGVEQGRGEELKHRFEQTGSHWIEATEMEGGVTHRGLVQVREAEPPALTLVRRMEDDTLSLTFDEPIALEQARAIAPDGRALPWGAESAQSHRVLLPLLGRVKAGETLTLMGITDTAPGRHAMARTTFRVPGSGWPQSTQGLVYAWEDRDTPPLGVPGMPERSGRAFWNLRGGMDVRGGTYEIPGAGEAILRKCGRTGAFTLEAIITPMVPPYDRETRPVLSLEDGAGNVKLALLQRRSDWTLWLATEDNPRGTSIEQELLPLRTGQPHHITVSYEKQGQFRVFLNGQQMAVPPELHGPLRMAGDGGVLRIGTCSRMTTRWHGMVDQLAVYNRALGADEAVAHADYAEPKLAAQRAVRTRKVVARRVQSSRLPALAEVAPYREALVRHLYEVLPKDKEDGDQEFPVGTRLAVVQWVWVNGEAVRPPADEDGVYRLYLQPAEAHREIQPLVIKDDLPMNGDGPGESWLEVSNW